MFAARFGCDATMRALLSRGANHDLTDHKNDTALVYAIISECDTTIVILASLTTVSLDNVLYSLAKYQTDISPAISKLLERYTSNVELAMTGLMYATRHGAVNMVKILSQKLNIGEQSEEGRNKLLKDAVMSDSLETCEAILEYVPNVLKDMISLAIERGRSSIINLFAPGNKDHSENSRHELKNAIMNETASILDLFPKSEEFQYNDNMDKVRPLLKRKTVSYSELLKALHVPPVHADKDCPIEYQQQQKTV